MSESLVSHIKAIIICLLGLWLVSGVIVYRRDTVTFTFECGNYINTVDSSNRSFEVQIYCGGIDLESVRIDSSLAFEEFFKIVNALLQILFLAILFKNANVYATLIVLIVNVLWNGLYFVLGQFQIKGGSSKITFSAWRSFEFYFIFVWNLWGIFQFLAWKILKFLGYRLVEKTNDRNCSRLEV